MKEEIKNASRKMIGNPLLEASYGHLFETPFHGFLLEVRG
jgi:hypothetical protein